MSEYVTDVGAFPVRGLKRGEIKGLREKGINFGQTLACDLDFALEETAKLILNEEQMGRLMGDDIPMAQSWGYYLEVIKHSYLIGDQSKNSG